MLLGECALFPATQPEGDRSGPVVFDQCTGLYGWWVPQEYLCRRCGATYTSLDAVRLLDPATGAFHCEDCRAELDANIEVAGLGGSGGGAASRQQMQQYAKRMMEKVETQLRPILGAFT